MIALCRLDGERLSSSLSKLKSEIEAIKSTSKGLQQLNQTCKT
jgi:hypothetical protein